MASNDWWSKKLGSQTPNQTSLPPMAPPPGNQVQVPQYQQGQQVAYDPNRDQMVSKAQSSRMNDLCPGCMSGNYFAPTGTNMKRCYDCGYPIVQSGTGAGMPGGSSGGPTIPAKQPTSGNNFNPSTIVGRIE